MKQAAKKPNDQNKKYSLKHVSPVSKANLLIFVIIFAAIGGYFVFKSLAVPNPNLPGDLDNDNTVNLNDLTILSANANTSSADADIDHNGIVDFIDLGFLLSNYGRTIGDQDGEIASEQACPNQTNVSASDAVKYTAMICLTNHARAFNGGLGPLAPDSALVAATPPKVNDIINCNDFSHTACGRPFDYWIMQNHYSGHCWGENIAYGFTTVRDIFVVWMNSPGHRANILKAGYTDIGLAQKNWPGHGQLWVENLGGCR